jgi:hypothetical protein
VHAAPRALREALRFRAGGYVDELEAYRGERDNALDWSLLGRVLDEHTEPGESLVVGGIGAIGYHSELYLHDQFGLVTRARDVDLVWERLNEPGHDRYIPAASFLRHRPTYLSARLARASEPPWTEPEQGPWSSSVEVRTFDLDERSRDGEPLRLELMRLTDWDDFALPFLELAAFVRDVGLDDREEAEAEVRRRARDRARRVERIERELRRLVDSGRVFPSPDPPALRLVTQGKDTLGYRIVALHLAGEIPPTQAPRGAVRFAVALGGEPTLDGEPPGWSVVEPGERLGRRVAGGRMLVVCLSPSVP